jgi:hypothetical protein
LKIATRELSDFGAWRSTLGNVRAGQTYCFNAWFRTTKVDNDRRSVIARLQWLDANGEAVGHTVRPPEYPLDVARVDGWVKMESIVRAPETAAALDVQLSLCWDVQFPEPWRALGLQGAEVILLPIWGGSETLLRARAIENHAFVVSSSFDLMSWVVAPNGDTLAEATKEAPVATAEVDLDRKIYQRWIGDMSTRTWKERRGYLGQ